MMTFGHFVVVMILGSRGQTLGCRASEWEVGVGCCLRCPSCSNCCICCTPLLQSPLQCSILAIPKTAKPDHLEQSNTDSDEGRKYTLQIYVCSKLKQLNHNNTVCFVAVQFLLNQDQCGNGHPDRWPSQWT